LTEAVTLIEKNRQNIPKDQRMAYLEQEVSAYQFLIMAHGKLNNAHELYSVMEKSRARVMTESFANKANSQKADIKWLQKNLAKDEAAISYSVAESAGSVVISVVTSDRVYSVYPEYLNFHQKVNERFSKAYGIALKPPSLSARGFNPFEDRGQDKMTSLTSLLRTTMEEKSGLPKDVNLGVQKDILHMYYQFLIKPIEPYIRDKKRLLISPDGYLSFIPFDALLDSQGRYLAEKYVSRFTPSMSIFRRVSERNYSSNRKNILAFGDARYAPYDIQTKAVSDSASYAQLLQEVTNNFKTNKSQRRSYAKLGVTGKSWTYLKGTKIEVEEIAKAVHDVDLRLNNAFTEPEIKRMSRTGELKNYKVLHLATHGMVVPSIPELSTVITSFSMTEDNGEDGYLTAKEISDLDLNADFVVLSACQTGLGKVYAGEGVNGLNSALLIAGANATGVTLWSVSDYGTMRLMIGVYDLVYNKGSNFADAMTEMKRRFIRGEIKDPNGTVYNDPTYWAPFVSGDWRIQHLLYYTIGGWLHS